MRFDSDTLSEIIDTITRNKSRSVLTAFGVFWGIFILSLLSGGGHGLENSARDELGGIATNAVYTRSSPTNLPYKGFNRGRWWNINNNDINEIRAKIPEVEVVMGMSTQWNRSVIYGENKYDDCSMRGLEPQYSAIEPQPMKFGRFLNEFDLRDARKVCVLGKEVYEKLFSDGENPCGQCVTVDGVQYRVVGVSVSETSISFGGQTSRSILVPITTLCKTYGGGSDVDFMAYTVSADAISVEVQQKVANLLKKNHLIHPDDTRAINAFDTENIFSSIENVFLGLNILVWVVGLGTLIAGVIGVSNIMLVTIRERTSEIGIRRAIGAHSSDILMQIIFECIMLTLFSGLLGLCFGTLVLEIANYLIANYSDFTIRLGVSIQTGIGMTVTLTILGVLAALAPAARALSIKPIEAIQEE